MCKAEEKALKKYPVHSVLIVPARRGGYYADSHLREGFVEGYHQAEKDSELTWQDIKQICDIEFEEACRLQRNKKSSLIYKEQHFQEVLKRFKEVKRSEKDNHNV